MAKMEEENALLLSEHAIDGVTTVLEDNNSVHRVARIGFPCVLVVLLVLGLSGPLVDSYFTIKGKDLIIPSYSDSATKLVIRVPAGIIKSSSLELTDYDMDEVKYRVGDETVDHADFVHFHEQILGMRYTILAWSAIQFLSYMGVILLGLALSVYLWSWEFPTTHIFKVGLGHTQSWRGSLPAWCVFFVAVLAMFRVLLVTSFAQSLSTRVAIHAIHTTLGVSGWPAFVAALDGSNPRTYELEVLIALGVWYKDYGAFWGFSTFSIVFEAVIALTVFVSVFYLDSRIARSRVGMLPDEFDYSAALSQQLANLPSHCRMFPLWVSVASLLLSFVASKMAGMVVFNAGQQVNRLQWESTLNLEPSQPIDDIILSKTNGFWFNPAAVVDGAVMAWTPLVVLVVIGSVARWHSLSKLLEIISYGYWIRALSILVTTYPTSMSVLQTPQCYADVQMGLLEAISSNEFCNDIMYSGHATLVLTPAFILILMIIYGPFEHKALAITGICFCVFISVSIVVVGRFHYTADVLVAALVCFLLALVHAPAWKVLFSVRKFELRHGAINDILKVAAELEEVGTRTVSLVKARRIDYQQTSWIEMGAKLQRISELVEQLAGSDPDPYIFDIFG